MSEVMKVKIVLVGECGVGKTNILTQYISHSFDINSVSTFSAVHESKTIHYEEKNKSLNLELWDTAGQERFRALAKLFYKDATAAILVYDITRRDSFKELKDYWYHEIKERAPKGTIIGIAANKADLYVKGNVAVPEKEGRAFAKKIGAIYRNTSAMTADGIEDLFFNIGKKIIDPSFKDEEEINYEKSLKENNEKNEQEAPNPSNGPAIHQRDTIKLAPKKNKKHKKHKCIKK